VASEIVIVTVLLAVEKLIFGLADIYDILTALEKAGHAAHLPLSARARAQVVPLPDPPGMSVALRGVTYKYAADDQFVLRDLSFTIGAGEHVALTGPHGAGVSTTLAAVAGLLEDWTGAVQLDGRPLRDLDQALVAEQIAWGGMDGDVIDGTIEENVALGRPGVRTEQVLEALARVGLADWLARQPDGVLTPAPVDGKPWPRHIVARLQLARMVAGRPRLIVADRILDLLDPAERAELLPILFDRSAGWSCLVASHHADILYAADRVVRLERGQVAHDAAPAAVFAADPWCRQLEGSR
jgi:ABC-type transport system involved in cytochrome bd biosynthesis fused ATPase/permease subunit